MSEKLTIVIDRAKSRHRFGMHWVYWADSGADFAAHGGNHGCTSVVQITDIIRRVYGKDTRIIQKWDGKERK